MISLILEYEKMQQSSNQWINIDWYSFINGLVYFIFQKSILIFLLSCPKNWMLTAEGGKIPHAFDVTTVSGICWWPIFMHFVKLSYKVSDETLVAIEPSRWMYISTSGKPGFWNIWLQVYLKLQSLLKKFRWSFALNKISVKNSFVLVCRSRRLVHFLARFLFKKL